MEPEAIAEDYMLTAEPLGALFTRLGRPSDQPIIDRQRAARGTTARDSLLATLEELGVVTYQRDAGVSADDLKTLHSRLVE